MQVIIHRGLILLVNPVSERRRYDQRPGGDVLRAPAAGRAAVGRGHYLCRDLR